MAWLIEVLFQDFLLGDCHSENFISITSTKESDIIVIVIIIIIIIIIIPEG